MKVPKLRRQTFETAIIERYRLEPLEIARRIVTQKITSGRITGRLSRSDANDFCSQALTAGDMTSLHMVEAQAALRYFAGMKIELRHKPQIWPNAWNTWTTRLSPICHLSPRHAVHPVNAVLNLAYTVAVNQLTRALAAHGLDPCCGFLHNPKDYRASLAYDALELLRADIDTRMLSFLASRVWSRADFPVLKSGIVRLRPALARVVASRAAIPPADLDRLVVWIADAITGKSTAPLSRRSQGTAST